MSALWLPWITSDDLAVCGVSEGYQALLLRALSEHAFFPSTVLQWSPADVRQWAMYLGLSTASATRLQDSGWDGSSLVWMTVGELEAEELPEDDIRALMLGSAVRLQWGTEAGQVEDDLVTTDEGDAGKTTEAPGFAPVGSPPPAVGVASTGTTTTPGANLGTGTPDGASSAATTTPASSTPIASSAPASSVPSASSTEPAPLTASASSEPTPTSASAASTLTRLDVQSWSKGQVQQWATDVVGLTDADAGAVRFTGKMLLAAEADDLVDRGISPEGVAMVVAAVAAGRWTAPPPPVLVPITEDEVKAWKRPQVREWALSVVGLTSDDASALASQVPSGKFVLLLSETELIGDDRIVELTDDGVVRVLAAVGERRFGFRQVSP